MSKTRIILAITTIILFVIIWVIVSYKNWKNDPFRPMTESETIEFKSKVYNNDTKTISSKEKSEIYLNLSSSDKIKYSMGLIDKSNLIISKKYPTSIPDNSIFYIITDSLVLETLPFKKWYNFPIIVRFSDRQVHYSGNRFEDGGLDRNAVGAAYDNGEYAGEGMARDIQIYQADEESGSNFVPVSIGYITNNLGGYEVFDFEEMKELPGLPGAYRDIFEILNHLGKVADNISKEKIKLKDNKNYLFYLSGSITSEFRGKYLSRRRKD